MASAIATPWIGIDLGTTYSRVGVYRNGNVAIISNNKGNRTTPSCVAFTNTDILTGEAAKHQATLNPNNTVFDVKRVIGLRFEDDAVQSYARNWSFKLANDCGMPKIQVDYKGESKTFSPEEVTSMVLVKMKETAEVRLGHKVSKAVITVPAFFNYLQRQATRNAAAISGFEEVRIFNEPTAAALYYGWHKKVAMKETLNVLVFHLGGGTFDVSIATIGSGLCEVKSTSGDTQLGGENFDSRMVNYFIEEFKQKHNKDLSTNPQALLRLRTACENAKRILSTSLEAPIELHYLYEGIDFFSTITRARFEELCAYLFLATLTHVENALSYADIDKKRIDEIILVGGSTQIPKIQNLLQDFFNGKNLFHFEHPSDAAVYGAALQGFLLNNYVDVRIPIAFDIVPLSFKVDVTCGLMKLVYSNFIARHSCLPTKRSEIVYVNNEEQVSIKVFEGESLMAKENNLVASKQIKVSLSPCTTCGAQKIEIAVAIDENGVLTVTAENAKLHHSDGAASSTSGRTRWSK